MARTRLLNPAFFLDPRTASLNGDEKLLYLAMQTIADRNGVLPYQANLIKANCVPYTGAKFDLYRKCEKLSAVGLIKIWQAGTEKWILLVRYPQDQKIPSGEKPLGYPAPPIEVIHSLELYERQLVEEHLEKQMILKGKDTKGERKVNNLDLKEDGQTPSPQEAA